MSKGGQPGRSGARAKDGSFRPGVDKLDKPIYIEGLEPGIPPAPKHLKGEALDEWNRVTPILEKIGSLTHLDYQVLVTYCEAVGAMRETANGIAMEGYIIARTSQKTGDIYEQVSPYVTAYNNASALMMRCATELGLTPSNRKVLRKVDKATVNRVSVLNRLEMIRGGKE